MSKKALITGVTGQDGSYLAELLLDKGYEVHGMVRRSSTEKRERIDHLEGNPNFHVHYGDLSDSMSIMRLVGMIKPDEIYNLAAQSHVGVSFDVPEYTADVVATGVLRILEAVRLCGLEKTCRIYQASTSELYGKVEEVPQRETTPFHPYSPYAVAKQYGYWIVKEYREAYNMFCCSGILFNHESERRGETFVTRKITLAAARIAQGKQDKLYLGNLSSLRDWGYAKDYVECMWLILQHDKPEDFVIATGVQHSVREFCEYAFREAGIELEFKGEGMDEVGIDKATGKVVIEVSKEFYRPTDVVNLWGDPTKAKTELGWNPTKTTFEELVKIMDWTNTHVTSTIYLCWAAQAGLYHHYGLKKRKLDKKMFGLFWHKVMNRKIPLVRGFDDMFLAPHSRHTEVPIEDIHNCKELTVLAESDEAGLFLAMADGGRKIFVMGHPEYDRVTLDGEYKRDVSKNLPIEIPENYYKDNNPENRPLLMWRAHANNLYTNWLNYYVYQSTPFDLYGTPDFEHI